MRFLNLEPGGLSLIISETNRFNWPAHPGDPAFITYLGTDHPEAVDDLLDNIGYRVRYEVRKAKRAYRFMFEAKIWGLKYEDAIALTPNPAPTADPLHWQLVDRLMVEDDFDYFLRHMAHHAAERV